MARPKRKNHQKTITILILTLCIVVSGFLCLAEEYGSPLSWDLLFDSLRNDKTAPLAYDNSIHFIDVGQGDCALLVSGDKAGLIDCGEDGSGKVILKYLKSLKIKSLDFILFSHNDSDHIGGGDEVIKAIPVSTIYADEIPDVKDNESYEKVVYASGKTGAKIVAPINLQEITLGDMKLTIYVPTPKDKDDENENGIVVLANVGGEKTLFTGDIGSSTEEILIKKYPNLDCDILKVGHHGSKHSTDKDFLKVITPEYSVISVGRDNSYGHPTSEVLDRLDRVNSKIYRTDILGSIVFSFDNNGVIAPAS